MADEEATICVQGSARASRDVPKPNMKSEAGETNPPKVGSRPIVDMFISWGNNKKTLARVLMDSGANV
jgi:hypothetical protein